MMTFRTYQTYYKSRIRDYSNHSFIHILSKPGNREKLNLTMGFFSNTCYLINYKIIGIHIYVNVDRTCFLALKLSVR